MNRLDKLAKTLVESQDRTAKTSPYDTTAVVTRVEGETAWVHIPDGEYETPAVMTISAKKDDAVRVRVVGGKAYLIGNATSPPTDDSYAQKAEAQALRAQRAANTASEQASIATESATQAIADAQVANDAATQAVADASTAKESAAQAIADAATAHDAADEAQASADAAQADADIAKASAENASEYAARALGNLGTVQSVAETLNWITAHGTMTLTTDVALDPTHVYFVVDANGDYVVGNTHYSVVTEPDVDDISTYYELSIDESLNNYVGTHLAVTSEGLWLLPDAGGNKVLIATGQGSTYTSAGTYIIGKVNNLDTVLATFGANGVMLGKDGEQRTQQTSTGLNFIDENGIYTAKVSVDSNQCTIYNSYSTNQIVVGNSISLTRDGLDGLIVDGEYVYLTLYSDEDLYTAINTLGWVSDVIE